MCLLSLSGLEFFNGVINTEWNNSYEAGESHSCSCWAFLLRNGFFAFLAPAAAWAGASPSHPQWHPTHLFGRSQFKLEPMKRKSSWVILAVSPNVPPFAALCVDDSNNAKFACRKCRKRSWLNDCWWLRGLMLLRVGPLRWALARLSRGCSDTGGAVVTC